MRCLDRTRRGWASMSGPTRVPTDGKTEGIDDDKRRKHCSKRQCLRQHLLLHGIEGRMEGPPTLEPLSPLVLCFQRGLLLLVLRRRKARHARRRVSGSMAERE